MASSSQNSEARTDFENPENKDESDSEPAPVESFATASSSDSDSDSDSDYSDYEPLAYVRPDGTTVQIDDDASDAENIPEVNIRRFARILGSKRLRREEEEEEEDAEYPEDQFDFPPDPENWKEEDLMELWADAPIGMTKPGWDPNWVDEEEVEVLKEEIKAGRDPPIAPFYVPYRKYYPAIPDNHHDISTPKAVIEELDRIEEFLKWVSYIFEDGSSWVFSNWIGVLSVSLIIVVRCVDLIFTLCIHSLPTISRKLSLWVLLYRLDKVLGNIISGKTFILQRCFWRICFQFFE